jgi:signal transduction histidine kinase/ActR/RegA family two-component response regulator
VIWSDARWRQLGLAPNPVGPTRAAWLASLHPDDRQLVLDTTEAAFADPARQYEAEYRVVWPDGSIRWLMAKGKVVRDAQGRAVRLVCLSMDVTESRETEAALRRLSSDLEERVRQEVGAREAAQARAAQAERMQALGQLAGGIAHDFNNVLQGVAGAAALIERRPGDEPSVRRLARLAVEAAERGASITRRLLAFGRRGDLRAEALDAAELLSGLREIFTHTLGSAIDVQVRLGAGLAPLLADKGQLETVLVNLATNGRDAMPGGGRLTLSAEPESVSAAGGAVPGGLPPGRYVRLAVADTGAGMDGATLGRAGEPFFTTKPVGLGTGLGLPMAKGFAEQSGGALGIASSPGQGTVVTLWLPEAPLEGRPLVAAMPRAAVAPPPVAGATPQAARVLVVDDEDLVREVIAQHLEDAGYRVLVAANGTEALALLADGEAIDALATDLSMPDMDGLAVIRAAQDRYPGLPAVLLTGYAGDGAALAVGGAVSGTFSLLRKPVSGVQLVDRVRALLAARRGAGR